MNLVVLGDRLLCKKEDVVKKTPGGIIIPDAHAEEPQSAVVISTGELVEGLPNGSVVLLPKYSGTKVTLDNQEYIVVREEDVIGYFVD